jgi:hypothetical protein
MLFGERWGGLLPISGRKRAILDLGSAPLTHCVSYSSLLSKHHPYLRGGECGNALAIGLRSRRRVPVVDYSLVSTRQRLRGVPAACRTSRTVLTTSGAGRRRRDSFSGRGIHDSGDARGIQDCDAGDDIDFDFGSLDFWRANRGRHVPFLEESGESR